MARKDRTGERKTRDQRTVRRIPEMGYYLVVTDAEATERCYFTGLHDSLPDDVKKKLVIKVIETRTQNLIQKCLEMTAYEAQYRVPWIVFDRDEVPDFDEIIRDAEKADIHVGWSNPCFEIWLFAYFGKMPAIQESRTCCSRFSALFETKTGQEYFKKRDRRYQINDIRGIEEDKEMRKKNCLISGDIAQEWHLIKISLLIALLRIFLCSTVDGKSGK